MAIDVFHIQLEKSNSLFEWQFQKNVLRCQKSVFVKKGWFIGSLANSFTAHGYKNGDIQVATGSESNWIISGMKYYVTVYYTLSNEVLNESNS